MDWGRDTAYREPELCPGPEQQRTAGKTTATLLSGGRHYFPVAASWVLLFDRYGRIMFVAVAGIVLVLEVLRFSTGRFYSMLLAGCAALIATTLLNAMIKAVVRKERRWVSVEHVRHPLGVLVMYSFPSFHAQIAFTMTGVASWFAWRVHWTIPASLYVLAVLTAISRSVLKAHDRTDIAWGAVIGTVVAVPACIFLGGIRSPVLSIGILIAAAVLLLWIPHKDFFKGV